jgi:hypothetical protein
MSGCKFYDSDVLHSNDVDFKAVVRPFYNTSEYCTYFKTNDTSDIGKTVRVDIEWHLKDVPTNDKQFYAPYIMVIPSQAGWVYSGSHKNIPLLIGNRTSVSNEVVENVFGRDHSYDWQNIDTVGVHTRAKSFGQEFVTLSFRKNNLSAKDNPQFKIYMIYYNPIQKTGWYKFLNQNVNLVGLPETDK